MIFSFYEISYKIIMRILFTKTRLVAILLAVSLLFTACSSTAKINEKEEATGEAAVSDASAKDDVENAEGQGDDERTAEIVASMYGADTHNHVDVPLAPKELPGPKVNLKGEMQKNGMSFMSMTFAVDYQKLTSEGEARERFQTGIDAMDAMLEDNGMTRALTAQNIRDAKVKNTPIVVQSVEGSHFLEGNIDRLKEAYDRGLRHLTLLHDTDASVPLGDVFTNNPQWGGLTDFGKEVIQESERLGILVDLSHADENTVLMALDTATKPVIISHTGLDTQLGDNEKMAEMMKPRLISAELAKKVADKGGLIGVWTHLADNPEEYAKNIRAMVDVVGVDHVTIGTDTKLTPAYPGTDEGNEMQGEQKKRAGGSTGYVWEGQKYGFFYTVVDAMLKEGFTKEEIQKICGGNYLDLLEKTIH